MRTVLAGVLGHVDHGKTALVGALTGIDTDRLREEKERGVSIVLGFAHLSAGGGEIDLIDMPGHERFVRTMVSGATGIEAVLLVVAANEGIRPQTVEHVEIARLIGARRGVIAVTKCDLVRPGEARRVAEDALALLRGIGLPAMPYVFTSALTGEGVGALARRLGELVSDEAERTDHGFFYLPVDRVFAAPGFGTVVTGTLRRGRVAVGDEVEILPGGVRARVRGLQVHDAPVDTVGPARRVAVNLRGVEWSRLRRGQALATPGMLALGRWLDVELTLLASAPRALESGRAVRLLFGTTEVSARVRLLDRDRLAPGATTACAQLRCEEEVAVPAREPFIVRAPSPVRTIGGGRVLDPTARRRRRFDDGVTRYLEAVAAGRPADAIAARLLGAGREGCRLEDLARLVGFAPGRVRPWLREVQAELFGDGTALHRDVCRDLRERLLARLQEFHRRYPAERGLPRERLRPLVPEAPAASIFSEFVAKLVDRGELVQDQGVIRRRDFIPPRARPGDGEDPTRGVEEAFRRGGLAPPDPGEIVGQDPGRREAVRHLTRSGRLVPAFDRVQKREIVFHKDAIARAKEVIESTLGSEQGFLVSEVGRALGISRKYSVPLLEYLDSVNFTRRVEDRRVVIRHRRRGGTEDGPGTLPARHDGAEV